MEKKTWYMSTTIDDLVQINFVFQGNTYAVYDKPLFTEKLDLESTSSKPVWRDNFKVGQSQILLLFNFAINVWFVWKYSHDCTLHVDFDFTWSYEQLCCIWRTYIIMSNHGCLWWSYEQPSLSLECFTWPWTTTALLGALYTIVKQYGCLWSTLLTAPTTSSSQSFYICKKLLSAKMIRATSTD